MRLAMVIEAVSQLGEIDLFAMHSSEQMDLELPPTLSVERFAAEVHRPPPSAWRWRSTWLAQRSVPMEVVLRTGDPSLRLNFARWVRDRYDVVWFSTAAVYAQMGRPDLGPTIVDLDNLEDVKAAQREKLLRSEWPRNGLTSSVRHAIAIAQTKKNVRDWRALQRSVAADVERVVLCSNIDLGRAGLPNAVVIPNTYPRPLKSAGHGEVRNPSVVLFQGSLTYTPNMDAAEWLVGQIVPRLQVKVPEVEVRLVGKSAPGVARLHHPPAVTVVGQVPEMEPELARADIAAVPLRIGSGTRLKILESFAHRVPVVSTTVGADGLDVQDGIHLLLADDAEGFAEACRRLLTDADLRGRLVDAAEELFVERYESTRVREQVQRLVRDVVGAEVDAPDPLDN
jgi:glycosyltransferase involved in cell wall biosynthesis